PRRGPGAPPTRTGRAGDGGLGERTGPPGVGGRAGTGTRGPCHPPRRTVRRHRAPDPPRGLTTRSQDTVAQLLHSWSWHRENSIRTPSPTTASPPGHVATSPSPPCR